MKLRDRELSVGDKCRYISAMINGTGATVADCTVTEVISRVNKIYMLTEIGEKSTNWVVQDIDEEKAMEEIGKKLVSLSWIEKIVNGL